MKISSIPRYLVYSKICILPIIYDSSIWCIIYLIHHVLVNLFMCDVYLLVYGIFTFVFTPQARTDDHDADEESAAETTTASSSTSTSKKSYRQPKKPSDNKKKPLHHPASSSTPSTPSGSQGYASGGSQGYGGSSQTGGYNSSGYETENAGGYIPDHEDEITHILQQQSISDPMDALSPHTAGGTFPSAHAGYLLPPPPTNMQLNGATSSSSSAANGVSYDHHMTHPPNIMAGGASHDHHMTHPNVKASRQRGGGFVLPAGQQQQQQHHQQQQHASGMTTALHLHQHQHFQQQQQQLFGSHQQQQQQHNPHSYQFYPSGYSSTLHSFESHSQPLPHSHLHPSSSHTSQLTQHSSTQPIMPITSGAVGAGAVGAATTMQINPSNPPQHSSHGGSADFGARNYLSKGSGTPASSGYSSFRSFSPPKAGMISRKSPSDIDENSVISSSFRSNSLHANSYSTFSSNSSRVSSPCSNSGRSDTLRQPHPSQSPMSFMVPKAPQTMDSGGYPLMRQTLRMNHHPSAYQSRQHSVAPPQATTTTPRVRQSDENSESSSRSTRQYSSHSSRYSFSGSELSDELLDSLPSSRRNSFTKNNPLPLPESMQRQFSEALDFHSGSAAGDDNMGMEFSPQSNSGGGGGGGGGGYHVNHQIQLSGLSDSSQASENLQPTLPLHHYDNGFTQSMYGDSSASNDSYDVLFSEVRAMSPNMVLGDMASFANTLPDETHYLEEILNGPVK